MAVATMSLAGCANPTASTTAVPTWELANAEPYAPIPLGRARLSFDRPLPRHLVTPLCQEYSLVVIRTAKDWAEIQRRLDLPALPPSVDLDNGCIVGLIANVGESADGRWPIRLRCLRRSGTQGSLDAAFSPGLYYPLLAAAYVDLVHAPGIHSIGLVTIDRRQFIIRQVSSSH
ncbi:MAG TPA: hypothetical protein VLM89_16185 [Phycisphaerae bacterium]|nr:hypothetical protein [Phycisphaerae bacterium]